MLLIDGVKYQEWTPKGENAEEELEQMVKEHAQDIFGEDSIYLDKKQKLKSLAGVGSIPDGLVIIFGNVPEWHIIEVELSSHDPYGHIVPQVDKFLNGVDNVYTRNKIIEVLYDAICGDESLKLKTRQAIGLDKDIHKFLSDLIARTPTITIIIEEYTSQLKEALKKYSQKKVIEFKTFTREVVGLAVHAHLFEPLHEPLKEEQKQIIINEKERKEPAEGIRKVTASDFTYNGNGIFAMSSAPSITINVKKRIKLVEEQLAKQGLWNPHTYSFYFNLRKKVGLLNTPTEG